MPGSIIYAVLQNSISSHKIFTIRHLRKKKTEPEVAFASFVVYSHLSSFLGTKENFVFNKETTFALTCFVWLRSKLPRDVVSIMLIINMFQ